MPREIDVAVYDGATLIQHCVCTARDFPDGAPGASWRGVLYPLLPGNRIDVGAAPSEDLPAAVATISGEGSTWVLVRGMPLDRAAVQARLVAAGVVVSRSGRWLGETVGDVAFDWFLRCEGVLGAERVEALLGRRQAAAEDPAARVGILEQHLLEMRAELARLEASLLLAARPAPETASPPARDPDGALDAALAQVRELQAQLDSMRVPRPAARPPLARMQDEVGAALDAFRPDVLLLRDSLHVAVGEFPSRRGFYRALRELPVEGGRPEGWKALRGAERWWERHVSTGQDDGGRAYARFDAAARRWSLLLGWKVEQGRDIEWIKRQG